MKVLSLFDGISCGRIALERAGIKVDKYYASEIDKNAIKISNKNYPDIVQLGDITKITEEQLKEIMPIDLIIGGSPCQDLSIYKFDRGQVLGLEGTKSGLFYPGLHSKTTLQNFVPTCPGYFRLMMKAWISSIL